LLGRLLTGRPDIAPLASDELIEVPLQEWTDVGGSKLRPLGMVGAMADLARIGAGLAAARAERKRRRD
jgi:hypothetical protein